MDIDAYISSGILENYVLGSTSDQERREVECMSAIYPEIKDSLTTLQSGIENLAIKAAVEPPVELKTRVLESVKDVQQEKKSSQPKVVPIKLKSNRMPIYRLLAAASIALMIGLGIFTYYLTKDLSLTKSDLATSTSELKELKSDFNQLEEDNSEMSNEIDLVSGQMAVISNQMNFIRNQSTKKVQLKGTADYADNLATVFWNKTSEKVLLDVQNLPPTAIDESYQLWVIVDGQPIDMGVFDLSTSEDTTGLFEMKATGAADAFAITREPIGGSIAPNLDNLHVIGTI
jgi:anti-sigma-K factor RskA